MFIMTEPVLVSRVDDGIDVCLNRPEKRNAITAAMYGTLTAAFVEAEADSSVRWILLRGAGVSFTAGNDLADFLAAPTEDEPPAFGFLRALATATVPVIAAVHGRTVGIGATLLLHCDHVVAADDTELRYPFTDLALVPEAASSLLLPRIVGHLAAAEILLAGQPVSATRALELGLVSKVVPLGEQVEAARNFASHFATKSPEAVRLTKRLLRDDAPGLLRRIALEGDIFLGRIQTQEFKDIAQALLSPKK